MTAKPFFVKNFFCLFLVLHRQDYFSQMDAENATWRQEIMWDDNGKRAEMGTKMFCDVSPHIMLNSHGVSEIMASGSTGMEFWEYPLPQLEIIILSTFLFWRFFDILFKKLGVPIPKFTSMMLVSNYVFEYLDMIGDVRIK